MRLRVLLCLGAAAAAVAACGSTGSNGAAAKGSHGAPYVVGVSTDLSGPASAFGAQEATMAKMLFAQVNAQGGIKGHQVKLIVKDNGNDPLQAVLDAKSFVAAHANVMMFGPTATTMRATEPFGAKTLIVDFGSGYVPPTPSNIFSISPYDSSPLGVTMRWLKASHLSSVGLISSNDAAGQTAQKEVTTAVQGSYGAQLGLKLTKSLSFNPKSPDVTAEVNDVLNTHPGAVISWVSGSPAAAVAKTFTQLSPAKTPLVVSWANGSLKFAKSTSSFDPKYLYAPVFKAMLASQIPAGDRYAALGKQVGAQLKAASGQELDEGGVLAYDPVQMVVRALNAGTKVSDQVAALQSVSGFQGMEGTYTLTASDHKGEPSLQNDSIVIAHVVNGAFTVSESAG